MASNQFDQRVLELINTERASAGLDALAIDSQLDTAANLHTDEMAQADLMTHQLPGKAGLGERVSATGYDWKSAAQSIAAGYTSPEDVVDGWLNSSTNRKNIFNPEFTEIGIGFNNVPDGNSSDYDTYWTQVFGSRNDSTPQNNKDVNVEIDKESSPEKVEEVKYQPEFNFSTEVKEIDDSPAIPNNQNNVGGFDGRVLELVNQERAVAGLDELAIDSQLDRAADLHNREMVKADSMQHQLPGEAKLGDRVSATGYNWSRVAENIAAGQQSPEEVVDGWMNSPGHRKNILNPKFTHMGLGYDNAPDNNNNFNDYDTYWTQVFGASSNI